MTTLVKSSARLATAIEVFDAIRDAACNLAVWERETIGGIDAMIAQDAQDLRFSTTLGGLKEQLEAGLEASGFAAISSRAALIQDIGMLAQHFCAALSIDAFDVQLEIVTTDSCRKFHGDYVTARLITTYVGTGTQWLENDDAEMVAQGLEPRRINTLRAGDVGLFKGKLATETPCIHRSPPIGGTGERRLLLVLNPAKETQAKQA
ncbi:MAG: DUF1826 domain-containing protein [Pseudomonadota bacterium]